MRNLMLILVMFVVGALAASAQITSTGENIKDLEKRAKNDTQLQIRVGDIYMNADGVVRDPNEAMKWYKKAAKYSTTALVRMGDMYVNGDGVKRNYAKAEKLYKKAIESGDTLAMLHMANRYPDNLDWQYYNMALDKGCITAAFTLAPMIKGSVFREIRSNVLLYTTMLKACKMLYDKGYHEAKIFQAALHFYRPEYDKAVETCLEGISAFPDDEVLYTSILAQSYEALGDKKNAMEWHLKGVEKGNPTNIFYIGKTKKNEIDAQSIFAIDITTAYAPAIELLTRAKNAGIADAGKLLDEIAARQKQVKSIPNYKKVLSDNNALFNLGEKYWVENKQKEATECFNTAAAKGNDKAMFVLGCIAYNNDRANAIKWFRKAAEKGNVKAMNNLGVCLAFEDKMDEALKWFNKGVQKKDKYSTDNIKIFDLLKALKIRSPNKNAKRNLENARVSDYSTWDTLNRISKGFGSYESIGHVIGRLYEVEQIWNVKKITNDEALMLSPSVRPDYSRYFIIILDGKSAICEVDASRGEQVSVVAIVKDGTALRQLKLYHSMKD